VQWGLRLILLSQRCEFNLTLSPAQMHLSFLLFLSQNRFAAKCKSVNFPHNWCQGSPPPFTGWGLICIWCDYCKWSVLALDASLFALTSVSVYLGPRFRLHHKRNQCLMIRTAIGLVPAIPKGKLVCWRTQNQYWKH